MQTSSDIKALIRTIPDFPKPGIMFRDVTTLFLDPVGLRRTIEEVVTRYDGKRVDKVIAIESRGFIIGGAIAERLKCGLVLARKKGKLPGPTEQLEYQLEYGTDCIEIHKDAIFDGDNCLIVDDLLATGGTCAAVCKLVERFGGKITGCTFIVNLPELKGDQRLKAYDLHWLCEFDGH
jgi:adenine phosphoribosyltransferase